jgi:hypothetical protein
MEKRWQDRWFTGHVSFRLLWLWPTTVYGANAMHWAINVHTKRWGYLCFHPTTRTFGGHWPWYFYVSRDATPCRATFHRQGRERPTPRYHERAQ